MTATVDPAPKQMARFVVMYDTPSDVGAFERHYNDVHIPLAKQYPGLRRARRARVTRADQRGLTTAAASPGHRDLGRDHRHGGRCRPRWPEEPSCPASPGGGSSGSTCPSASPYSPPASPAWPAARRCRHVSTSPACSSGRSRSVHRLCRPGRPHRRLDVGAGPHRRHRRSGPGRRHHGLGAALRVPDGAARASREPVLRRRGGRPVLPRSGPVRRGLPVPAVPPARASLQPHPGEDRVSGLDWREPVRGTDRRADRSAAR